MNSSNPVFELLDEPVPDRLWHYTSGQGFLGIVTSKSIFATDARFLNDREEFIHASKIAWAVVEETPELGPNDFPSKEFLRMIVTSTFETGLVHPDCLQTFVASFSAVEDQLSQWRGYSRGTSGVSLGLQLGSLRKRGAFACFAPCVYEPARKRDLIRYALHQSLGEIQGYWDEKMGVKQPDGTGAPDDPDLLREAADSGPSTESFQSRLEQARTRMYVYLVMLAALLKNESFSEEQEWRLVIRVLLGRENPQNRHFFRAGNTTLIPYIAQPLSSEPDAPVPLTDVILGPGGHPNAVQATQAFLRSEGVDVTPRGSKVPYRPW